MSLEKDLNLIESVGSKDRRVNEFFVKNGPEQIHVMSNGRDGALPFLFVPGMFGVAEHCVAELENLRSAPAYALSVRGRGRSSFNSPKMTVEVQASDIVAVAEDFSERPSIVCGHSYGSLLAVLAAKSCPEQFAGLVLIDKGLSFEGISPFWFKNIARHPPGTSCLEVASAIFESSQPLDLWDDFASLGISTLVVKGQAAGSKLQEDELVRFRSHSFVEVFEANNSGHFPDGEDYFRFMNRLVEFRTSLSD